MNGWMDGWMDGWMYDCTTSDLAVIMADSGSLSGFKLRYESPVVRTTDVASCF